MPSSSSGTILDSPQNSSSSPDLAGRLSPGNHLACFLQKRYTPKTSQELERLRGSILEQQLGVGPPRKRMQNTRELCQAKILERTEVLRSLGSQRCNVQPILVSRSIAETPKRATSPACSIHTFKRSSNSIVCRMRSICIGYKDLLSVHKS